MRNDDRSWLGYGLLLGSVLCFAALRYFFFAQTGDDSYIYFRYVERALAGQWWSWSNHIPPVEGYSSALWYLLLVASGKAGLPVILAARWWGVLFAFLTLCGTWVLARQLKASTLLSAIACLLLVLNHGFNYWASAGLETSMYAALLVWSCIGIVRERAWFLPTALLGLARPEGVFLLFALLCCIFLFKRRRFSGLSLLLCFLPTLLWSLLRFSIYGEWLPNTFYAKAAGDPADQFFKGLIYCLPVLLPLLAGWLLWWQERSVSLMVTLGMVSMLAGIVWLGGGDWMFHFRLLVPLYALLLAGLASQWQNVSAAARVLLAAVLLPYLLLMVPPHYVFSLAQGGRLPLSDYQEGNMTHVSLDLANMIRSEFPAPALIAVNHAGALPWALPEYDVIDMVGLNDAHIARAPGKLHHKYDIDYVLNMKPDLMVLNSRVRPGKDGVWYHKGYWSGEDALVDHPGFADYQPTGMVLGWHWRVPYPYSLVVKNAETSWIMVYRRKP